MDKQKQNTVAIFNIIRDIAIAQGIFPASFPKAEKVALSVVTEPKADWGGFGGEDENGKLFISINLAGNHTLKDFISAMAHEMIHVKQCACDKIMPHHGNAFRHDVSKLAKILGITYYHLSGYDWPSVQTVQREAKAKIAYIRKHHADKKSGKWKQISQ